MLWNKDQASVSYSSSSTQVLLVKIQLQNNDQPFWLSCVYAEPNAYLLQNLWSELITFSTSVSEPWCVIGDFNAYLTCEDKQGGSGPNVRSMRQFEDCVHGSNLIDVEYVGEHFTWEKDLLKERIDWAFTNN